MPIDPATDQPQEVGEVAYVGPPSTAVAVLNSAADQPVYTGRGGFCGYSLFGNGGAAQCQIYDGSNNGGTLLAEVQVASGGTTTVHFGVPGTLFRTGLFIKMISGTIRGCLYVVPLDKR